MKEYNVYYRERGNIGAEEFNCIITCSTKEEAKENFKNWDNKDSKYTVTRVEKI